MSDDCLHCWILDVILAFKQEHPAIDQQYVLMALGEVTTAILLLPPKEMVH